MELATTREVARRKARRRGWRDAASNLRRTRRGDPCGRPAAGIRARERATARVAPTGRAVQPAFFQNLTRQPLSRLRRQLPLHRGAFRKPRGENRRRADAQARSLCVLAREEGDGLDVGAAREHVDAGGFFSCVAALGKPRAVAGEGGGVARDVDDAGRRHGGDGAEGVGREAFSGRVDADDVGAEAFGGQCLSGF